MRNLPPKIPHAETLELIVKAQHGSVTARNAAITGNLRLVASIAESAAKAVNRLDLLDDLIMAGAMGAEGGYGLLHAVMHFDASRGVRFATYAHSYIRKAVDMQLASLGRDVGTYKSKEKLSAIRKVAAQLSVAAGRPVTAAETHAELQRRGGDAGRASLARVELALQRPGRETHEEASSGGEDEAVATLDTHRQAAALRRAAQQVLTSDEQALLSRRYGDGGRLTKAEAAVADAAEAKLRAAVAAG